MNSLVKYLAAYILVLLASLTAIHGQEISPAIINENGRIPAQGSTSSEFTIRNIIITGNKKTRPEIILRELPFKSGETYTLNELVEKFESGKRQLMNMALFNDAVVALKNSEGSLIDVMVDVKERWYLFPLPYFRPVDRNLNQWLVEKNASHDRVNYGV
jgi:hypothetical protein